MTMLRDAALEAIRHLRQNNVGLAEKVLQNALLVDAGYIPHPTPEAVNLENVELALADGTAINGLKHIEGVLYQALDLSNRKVTIQSWETVYARTVQPVDTQPDAAHKTGKAR